MKYTSTCLLLTITLAISTTLSLSEKCNSDDYVYGGNMLVDQLLACSVSKAFDLDLIPEGDRLKVTSKTLVDQGFSNKTTILHAKLNGLWTQRRANFVESGWRCEGNKTVTSSVIQIDGLSMEILEKVDIPISRNVSKLSVYRPCKTFELPTWLCRQSKPLFKTTRTWVSSAYFNLTLSQEVDKHHPSIERLALMFTCPETFKQKIVYSPTAMYLLSKYINGLDSSSNLNSVDSLEQQIKLKQPDKRTTAKLASAASPVSVNSHSVQSGELLIGNHFSSATSQDGRGPAAPPYHSSVNLIIKRATEMLHTSLDDCIKRFDSDLSLMVDHNSFNQYKYKNSKDDQNNQLDDAKVDESNEGIAADCSSKLWLKNRIDLSNAADSLFGEARESKDKHWKRSQSIQTYPIDPNQLLDPHGYYHENTMTMIDDSA